jgi:carboxypeptidase D
MTWNGLQGFQTPIANDSFIVDGVGALGTTHTERNLTYFEVELSGHMCVISRLLVSIEPYI